MHSENISAQAALRRLKKGNAVYLDSTTASGDVSLKTRVETCQHGQKPFAVIVACSDSRVVPEFVFSVGLGELFVVRVAGNVIDNNQLGSIQYAVEHLGCNLVVVLGHTHCGAVAAALADNSGFVKCITDEIKHAIAGVTDATNAAVLNVKHSVAKIKKLLKTPEGVEVVGALYRTENGAVDFDIE